MPSLTTISVNDRESTPVAHVYESQGKDANGVVSLAVPASVKIGEEKLRVSTRISGSNRKVRWLMTDPVLVTETINGVDRSVVERTGFANLEFTFHETSTTQERANLVGKLANLLLASQTDATSVNVDLESVW